MTFGEDRRIEAANPAAEGLLLYGPNELLGRDMLSLLPRECELSFLAAIQSELRCGVDSASSFREPASFPLAAERRAFGCRPGDDRPGAIRAGACSGLCWAQDNTSHDRATTQWGTDGAVGGHRAGRLHNRSREPKFVATHGSGSAPVSKKHSHDVDKVQCGIAVLASGTEELHRLHETVLEFVYAAGAAAPNGRCVTSSRRLEGALPRSRTCRTSSF